jgi:hypothetical protein
MIFVFGAKILGAKAWRRGYDNRGSGHKGQK